VQLKHSYWMDCSIHFNQQKIVNHEIGDLNGVRRLLYDPIIPHVVILCSVMVRHAAVVVVI